MSTLNELTYNVINIARAGRQSDDEMISKRQIAYMFKYYRSMMLKRELTGNLYTVNPMLIQDLGCVEVIAVDRAECCDITWDCKVLRTKDKVPTPVQISNGDFLITYVGLVDKITSFGKSSKASSRWKQYLKYTSNQITYYYHNGYIYLANANIRTKYININLVAEDPEEVINYNDCGNKECFTWDSKYPIPEYMIQPITQMILDKELKYLLTTVPDQTNDGPNNISPTSS